jgi:hypothetical protein
MAIGRRGALRAVALVASIAVSCLTARPAFASGRDAVLLPLRDQLAAGRDFAAKHPAELGLGIGETVGDGIGHRGAGGVHLRFKRALAGVPVYRGDVLLHVRPDGLVDQAKGSTLPPLDGDLVPALDARTGELIARAISGVPASARLARSQTTLFPVAGALRLAWEVWLFSDAPVSRWRVFVDAQTGAVLRATNLVKHIDGSAQVFVPNAVVALQDNSLTDQGNSDAAVPPAAYTTVTLHDLDPPAGGLYHLSGAYARAVDLEVPVGEPPASATADFSFTRSNPGFEWTMVYAHVDGVQSFLQSLGFTGVNNRPTEFDAHGLWGDDNSYYVPDGTGVGYLAFGDGGVDDAEDGEVIVHEYGHAIQDNQCPNCFDGPESGAIGEGFADFLAGAYFSDKSGGFQDTCMFDWDSRGFLNAMPACLRRLDTTKVYPDDLVGEVHADGEIWSGFLWDLLLAFGGGSTPTVAGRDKTVQLAVESHFVVPSDPSFGDAAQAVLDADQVLFGGANQALIRTKLDGRGLLPMPGAIIFGGGSSRVDCFAAIKYANPNNPKGPKNRRQVCVDGDPTCDADSIPGQCTFHVSECFGQAGLSACQRQPLTTFRLRLPLPDDSNPVRAAIAESLLSQVATLGNAIRGGRHNATVDWFPNLNVGRCSPPADLVVPLQPGPTGLKSRTISLRTTTAGESGVDRDAIKLVCAPHP